MKSNVLSSAVTAKKTMEKFDRLSQNNIKILSNCSCAVVDLGYVRAKL
jgi:hypothetical protein